MRVARLFLILCLAVAAMGSGTALAQHKTLFDAFRSIFQPTPSPNVIQVAPERPRKPRKTAPPVAPRRTIRPPRETPAPSATFPAMPWPAAVIQAPAPAPDAAPSSAATQPAPTETPAAKPIFFVQVLGDSLALLLAQGLSDALADHPEISVVKKARESSGLVRDDYYDWPKASRDLLTGSEQTDIALIMVGSNDHQPFYAKDGSTLAEPGSDEWARLYRARVEDEARLFKDKGIKLIWVGMPIMRSAKFSADMLQLNEIYKDVASAGGAIYVDVWQAFADEKGEFDAAGPDINGQPARLRTPDGIHFTRAGQRKLASFVEKDIRRAFDAKKPAPALPAPQPLADQPQPETKTEAKTEPKGDSKTDTKPDQETTTLAAPVEPVKPPRPVSGRVISLTAPPSAANGELLPSIASRKALTRLEEPDPNEAHAGRADDFSWPPN